MNDLISIYYLRDNHTFLFLSTDLDETITNLKKEFESGHMHGSMFFREKPTPENPHDELIGLLHARGPQDWDRFEAEVREFYADSLPKVLQELRERKNADDFRRRAMSLYTPPFRYHKGYILDSANHVVSDDGGVEEPNVASRVRGWGRISYLADSAALQDEVGAMIADALNKYYESRSLPV